MKAAEQLREYARQTMGSVDLHRHWTGAITYTDGIQYLAETCGAYWLIDAVASWQAKIARKGPGLATFQVWTLRRRRIGWTLEAWSDTPNSPGSVRLARQLIPYSDFPEDLAPFEWWVEYGTMMLKEER